MIPVGYYKIIDWPNIDTSFTAAPFDWLINQQASCIEENISRQGYIDVLTRALWSLWTTWLLFDLPLIL